MFRPARASKATPAYPESPATSQAPDHDLTVSQARTHPKAGPAYPDSTATSQARNSPLAPRRQLSCEPFEPLRDQVRRDAINPFTSDTIISKMAQFIPTETIVTAEGVGPLVADRLVRYHGLPGVLISDLDPRFTFLQAIPNQACIVQCLTSANRRSD